MLDLRAVVFTPDFTSVGAVASPSVPIDATWRPLEVSYTFGQLAYLDLYVSAQHDPGACFVIDDVTLERLK